MPKLKRILSGGEIGRDVLAIKRGLGKYARIEPVGDNFFNKPAGGYTDVYNDKTKDAVKQFQKLENLKADGIVGQATLDKLWPYMDLYAHWMYARFTPPKPAPKPVMPKQGWGSLDKSLWELFSIGRNMGLSDLGTYNPASRLPSGAPSDHAVYPAFAFDLGFPSNKGYDDPTARKFFNACVGEPEVHYVILGTKIWSKEKGLHAYTSGGHSGHVHVSGNR